MVAQIDGLASQIGSDEILALAGMGLGALFLLCGASVAAVSILAAHYRQKQRDDMEATLKMEMIERGFTAEDIERTLAARMGPPRGGCGPRGKWKPASEYQGSRH